MNKHSSKDTRIPLPPVYTLNTPAEMYYEYILASDKLREAVCNAIFRDNSIVDADPLGTHDCKEFWPQTIPLTIYKSSGTLCKLSEVSDTRPCDIDASEIVGVKNFTPFAEATTSPGMLAIRLGWLAQTLVQQKSFADLTDDQRKQLDWCFREDFTVKMSRYVMEDRALQITFFRPPDVVGGIPVCLWINPCKKKAEILEEFTKLLRSYDEIRQETGLAKVDKSVLQGFEEMIPCEITKRGNKAAGAGLQSPQALLTALYFWRVKKELDKPANEGNDPNEVFNTAGYRPNAFNSGRINREAKKADMFFAKLKSGIAKT